MWEPAVAAAFPYRNGEIIMAGFAGAPPDFNALETDHRSVVPLAATSQALLVFGRFINLVQGDVIRVVAKGPDGNIVDQLSPALDRNKATYVSYSGKRRRDQPWPTGRYEGRVELIRNGAVIAASDVAANIP
jgi:hypothetical protein